MTTYMTNDTWQEPLMVEAGQIVTVLLKNTAGCAVLDIQDNADVLQFAPSLFASFDGVYWQAMDASIMRQLRDGDADLMLRIDATQMATNELYVIKGVKTDKPDQITITGEETPDHHYYDASQRVFCEDDLHKMVDDNIMQLSKAAQDSAGWPIQYYRAKTLTDIDVLNSYELKSIKGYKMVDVFFPHRKTIGQLDFDQFGLNYEELTTIHVLADEFRRVYNSPIARPDKLDIVYIKFVDQFFEISEVVDVKTPTNIVNYYELTLKVVSDRKSVAKDEDLLDLSGLVDGNDFAGLNEHKNDKYGNEPEPVYETYEAKTWSMQTFSKTKQVHLQRTDNFIYGIAYLDGWKRFELVNNIITLTTLSGKDAETVPLAEHDVIDIYFAKMAEFDKELSEFDKNMYYTTPNISRTLQPLQLIELQNLA